MKGRQVMSHNIYIYILVMAGVSYLIRMLPLTLIRKEIKNKTIRSFLYYVPYVTLAVMTFPAILSATGSVWSAWAALIVATALAWFGRKACCKYPYNMHGGVPVRIVFVKWKNWQNKKLFTTIIEKVTAYDTGKMSLCNLSMSFYVNSPYSSDST